MNANQNSNLLRRFAGYHRAFSVVALAALAGCTYIGREKFVEKYDSLDEDGDGAVKLIDGRIYDCDDADATRSPDLEEIAYDGIDNDCDDFDLVDVDGDNFPGIGFDAYVASFGEAAGALWRSDIKQGDGVDCADDPATNTIANQIFPGAVDAFYDGIDSNCDGKDDFDKDEDGQALLASLLPANTPEYNGSLPQTDCDDANGNVKSGGEGELPYDGVDTNCDGANDFDQDGDGWMATDGTSAYAVLFNTFLTKYHRGVVPTSWANYHGYDEGTDCLDLPSSSLPGVDPIDVNPAQTDVYYDGIDSNCDLLNDFDNDSDGIMPPGVEADFETYLAAFSTIHRNWPLAAEWNSLSEAARVTRFGDCNDDPTSGGAEIFPGALERVGDDVDQDCDTGPNTTPFSFNNYSWTEPSWPSLGVTEDVQDPVTQAVLPGHYVLSTVARHLASTQLPANSQPGIVLTFVRNRAGFRAVPDGAPLYWNNAPTQGGTAVSNPTSMVNGLIYEGSSFWASTSYLNSSNQLIFLVIREFNRSLTSGSTYSGQLTYRGAIGSPPPGEDLFTWTRSVDLSLSKQDDYIWAIACGPFRTAGLGAHVSPTVPISMIFGKVTQDYPGAEHCTIKAAADNSRADVTMCTDADCFDLGLPAENPGNPVEGTYELGDDPSARSGSYRQFDRKDDGWYRTVSSTGEISLIHDDGTTLNLLTGENALWTDVSFVSESEMYLAAITDDGSGPVVRLVYGDPSAPDTLVDTVLPIEDFTFNYSFNVIPGDETSELIEYGPGRTLLPTHVSILANKTGTNQRLMVAVSAANADHTGDNVTSAGDAVGWAFYGFANPAPL